MTEAVPSQNEPVEHSVDMQHLVQAIARSLVDAPDLVSVETIQDGDATILRLRVGPGDIGKVIGRQGRTARSFRTILGAASMKFKRRYALDIVEAEQSQQS